jgi:integrase
MSYEPLSQDNRATDSSLADVLDAVRNADLPARRRQEIASALRTVTRALGRPLERVPADPRRLSARLKEVAPLAIGISQGRWNNIRALVRTGLTVVQPMSPGRHLNKLSVDWEPLWQQLPTRRLRMKLTRFLRFCSASGIEPEAVTEAAFTAYRSYLADSLLKNPDAVFGATVSAWRAAQVAIDGWPRASVPVAKGRNWTLPWDRFPASLHQDCRSWCHQLAGGDPFEDMPCRPVRPVTAANREWQIRSFASALVLRGRDPGTITSLRDLVEIEAFKDGFRFFIERSGGKATVGICNLARGLKAIARHHLQLDAGHLDKMGTLIRHLVRRLDNDGRGLTVKNRARLRLLDDRNNAIALLRLPEKLIGVAVRNPNIRAGALQAQVAVAVELLLMTALRIGNLVTLDLDQNIIYPGRGKAMHLVIEAQEVKNREPLDFPLPEATIELVEHYLLEFRPRLAPRGSTALFPGDGGRPKTTRTLRKQITDTVHLYTGLRMHPHLFRHAMAKLWLDANPGAYEIVKLFLGHKSSNTTTLHYTGLETASAVRLFYKTILGLRKDGH